MRLKPMSEQAVKMHRELAVPSGILDRDLFYFVTDRSRRPLLMVNAWGDNLELYVNDPWRGVHEGTTSSIPYGASIRDIRLLALEVASDDFDLDRDAIMLTGMAGTVLCR